MKYWQAEITVNIQAETEDEAQAILDRVKASVPEEVQGDNAGVYEYFSTQVYEDKEDTALAGGFTSQGG
jgi:hypothetical protein